MPPSRTFDYVFYRALLAERPGLSWVAYAALLTEHNHETDATTQPVSAAAAGVQPGRCGTGANWSFPVLTVAGFLLTGI